MEENNNNNNNNINQKENNTNDNCNPSSGEIEKNRRKSENNINGKNKNGDKNEVKLFIKSNTFNKNPNKISNNNNSNEPPPIDSKKRLVKARTCNEMDNINFSLGLNNLGPNHLGTVLEAINEVSNSNIDSSEKNINENDNVKSGKNDDNENGKIKEESANITSDQKI